MAAGETDSVIGCERLCIDLNHDWAFWKELDGRDASRGLPSQSVDLPHCWNERDTFQSGLRYAQCSGTYQRSFELPASPVPLQDARWHLRSDGFYGTGSLHINGKRVSRVNGEYLGIREDVTPYLRHDGENEIEVRLSNAYHRYVLPGKKNPDFLLHGGLAGAVSLIRLPSVYLDDRSFQVSCANPLNETAEIDLAVTVCNTCPEPRRVIIRSYITSSDNGIKAESVSESILVPAGLSIRTHQRVELEHPAIWDLEHPNLYQAVCVLEEEGALTDQVSSRFGLREVRFDGENGFFLNGTRIWLQGVNRHESVPGFGSALPMRLHREDAQQIRDLGLNFVRLSHYPQHPAFLDACDELGIFVYAEIASWKSVRPGLWARAAYRQLRAMIQRDRNHPSVVLWGFGNESRSRLAFRKMGHIAKTMDPTRDTIYAENHLHRGIRWRTLKQTSVLGINYELARLDDAHSLSKKGSVVLSEISNCAYTARGDEETELKQIAKWEHDLALIGQKPFVAGYALWGYADYASQRRDRCRRRPGIVDAWRLPKMSATYMQARTSRELFVGVHGKWAIGAGDGPRDIHIFSNAERLRVEVKGKLLADVPAKLYTLVAVPFSPDDLSVTAYRGDEESTASLISHGAAEKIVVQTDVPSCAAGDRDTVSIACVVVDGNGNTVADYHGEIQLAATGPGRIRFFAQQDIVEIHAGVGRCFVTGTGQPGMVSIRATQEGLVEGETSIAFSEE